MIGDFEFHVGGIEDGIIAALGALSRDAGGYVKQIASYGGELDTELLRRAAGDLVMRFPLLLVAYGDGEDAPMPATSTAFGASRIIEHRCTFTVFCCNDDVRGERARRRGTGNGIGVYRMVADVHRTLADLQLYAERDGERVLLNTQPLTPAGVEFVARLPDVTVYAVHFDTTFKYLTSDRSTAGQAVRDFIFDLDVLRGPGDTGRLPGVVLEE